MFRLLSSTYKRLIYGGMITGCLFTKRVLLMTSQRRTVSKKLKEIDNLVKRIKLTRAILMPRLSGFLRNSTIHFRTCLYFVTFF